MAIISSFYGTVFSVFRFLLRKVNSRRALNCDFFAFFRLLALLLSLEVYMTMPPPEGALTSFGLSLSPSPLPSSGFLRGFLFASLGPFALLGYLRGDVNTEGRI